MDLQQMRYAVAVAEEQNFTRAAARCHVVQSALSHRIKALERELGVELFARTSRRVEITAAGEAFLNHARTSLDAAERAITDAAAAAGRVQGTLTIGVIPTVTTIDIPGALREFRTRHPDVRVHLRVGASDDFIAAIDAGEMDAAVLGLSEAVEPDAVASRVLAQERLVAVLDAGHPLAGRSSVHLRDLEDQDFADFPAGTPGRAQSDLAFTAAGVQREVMFESMSTAMTLDLVRNGLAVTLLSPGAVPGDPALVTIPITDGPRRTEYLAWSAFNPSPAASAFLSVLPDLPVAPDRPD